SGDRCDNARDVSPGLLKLEAISSSTAFGSDVGPGLKLMSFTDGLETVRDPLRAGWVFGFIFVTHLELLLYKKKYQVKKALFVCRRSISAC
ncbi:hypothetical protein KKI24_03430, partial [bacterium]|nr:hypothetical protein [bacterium]